MYSLIPIGVLLNVLLTSVLVESICYFLIYKREPYQKVVKDTENLVRELKLQKSVFPVNRKAEKRLEQQLFMSSRKYFAVKMKGTFIMVIIGSMAFISLRQKYVGQTVAKLPFEPIWPFSKVLNRGLGANAGPNDCSIYFLIGITSVAIKNTITAIFGYLPSKQALHAISPITSWKKAMTQYMEMIDNKEK